MICLNIVFIIVVCISFFNIWFFFFFKQKTAYEMRISDWSSDVCSSDLPLLSRASNSSTSMPGAIPRQNAGASCANGTSNPARKPALYALSTSEVVPIPFIPMMRPNSTRKGPLSLQPTDIAILGNALSASTVRKPMALNGQRVTDLFEPTLSDHNNQIGRAHV